MNVTTEKQFIYKIVDYVCELLDVERPKIVYVDDMELNACLKITNKDGIEFVNCLMIKTEQANKVNLAFAIAHELRHVYQHKNKLLNNETFLSVGETDFDNYNLQETELDANAFATAFMIAEFSVMIDFTTTDYTDEIINKINKRAQTLLKEYWQ